MSRGVADGRRASLPGVLLDAERTLPPYIMLAALGAAVFSSALWFPPTAGDELRYLTSVAATRNPLYYFIRDHGHGNYLYRPLTSITIWLVYHVFGVWSFPNQVINLTLHIVSVCLLYRIMQRGQPDKALPFLFAALFMVSKYTWLAPAVVSDRPMVLTGMFLLLLIDHIAARVVLSDDANVPPIRISYVAALSVLALLSKESGLVVPALGLLFILVVGLRAHLAPRLRIGLAIVPAAIIFFYFILRVVIFGSHFAAYSQDGYMFLGLLHYQNLSDLPRILQYVAYAENVIKNLPAPVFPIFGEGGSLLTGSALLGYLPVIVPTMLLFGLAVSRRLNRLQLIALMTILVNAVVHFALFRYRLHYLSQAAFCLFVSSSPLLRDGQGSTGRKIAIKILAVALLLCSTLWVSQVLNTYTLSKQLALGTLPNSLEHLPSGIDRHIVEQVLTLYK